MSAAGAIVESTLSGAGGASEYGAIVASATSGVNAGAAAQQWQHRCVNPSQISSSGSLGDLGSGGGAERRARLNAAKRCLRRRGSGSSLRLACCRVCVCVCVCVRVAGGAHTILRCPYSEFTCCAPNAQSVQLVLESFVLCACSAETAPPVFTHARTFALLLLPCGDGCFRLTLYFMRRIGWPSRT